MKIIVNLALLTQFFLLQSFVYESMMKEIPITNIFVTSFLLLYIVFTGIYTRIFRKKINETFDVMLLVYGILIFLLAYLSVDRLLVMMPITKINSHSLYLTYIIAGLSGLTAIPVSYIFKYTLNSYTRKDFFLSFLFMILILISSTIIHTRTIIYILSILLITFSFIPKDRLKENNLNKQNGSIRIDKSIFIYLSIIFISLLNSFLNLKLGLGETSIILVLAILFLILKKLSASLSNLFFTSKIHAWISFLCLLGYHTSQFVNEQFGELVSFTSRRFYFVPTYSMMLILLIIGTVVLVFENGNSKT